MLTMFIRAIILYVLVIALIRLMGKRQIGQLQPFELVFTVIIADLAAAPMSDVGTPLLYGVMPIAALILCYALFSTLILKSEIARELISGRPTVLVQNGVINQREMLNQGITLPALLEQVREHDIQNLHEVGCAVLEISGHINVFPISQKRTVNTCDLQIDTSYESLPLHLIMDGNVQMDSLKNAGLSSQWLAKKLERHKVTIKDTYFCSLDTDGVLCFQLKEDTKLYFEKGLSPKEVNW